MTDVRRRHRLAPLAPESCGPELDDARRWRARVLLVAWGLVLAALAPCQPVEARRDDPARVHAAAAVGELSWRAPPEAYAAIVGVHVRRGALRGLRPELVARTYSQALRRPPRQRAWVPQLIGRGMPRAWPSGASWPRHARRFDEIVELAREVLDGRRVSPCPEATGYGGLMDAPDRSLEEVWRVDLTRPGGPRRAQIFYAPRS